MIIGPDPRLRVGPGSCRSLPDRHSGHFNPTAEPHLAISSTGPAADRLASSFRIAGDHGILDQVSDVVPYGNSLPEFGSIE
jgi:hypothetical protein